jgi:hypothetical protein
MHEKSRFDPLALDEVRVEGIEGDALAVHGFFGGSSDRFTVTSPRARLPLRSPRASVPEWP